MNLLFDNHCVSSSPSKIEGVGGEYDILKELQFRYYQTPQSLRDSSPILGEQLKHSNLFSLNSL